MARFATYIIGFSVLLMSCVVCSTSSSGSSGSRPGSESSGSKKESGKCMYTIDLSLCRPKVNETPPQRRSPECHHHAVCQKNFKISFVNLEPYTSELVSDLVRGCCGQCANVTQVAVLTTLGEIPPVKNSTAHFLFPVLGRSNIRSMYGYHFIPLVEVPSVYYITKKTDDVITHVIASCLNMWPMVIICLLMVAISGFVGWLLETWINNKQFPSPFLRGWFEGFWWSFISMTTVGYGDKVPKSIPARLFSIVWIFVGITTFSLVTAMLSSEIVDANSPPTPSMSGSEVGAIRNRLYDAILVEKHGGMLVDVDAKNVTEGIKEMVNKLMKNEIDGFVLDRYTLLLFNKFFVNELPYFVDVLKTKTVRTEVSFSGIPFAYGILVKDVDDYEFLADFIMDNRDVINTCNGLLVNSYSFEVKHEAEDIHNPLFSPKGESFWLAILAICTILAFICCFGFFYELKRKNIICGKACNEKLPFV